MPIGRETLIGHLDYTAWASGLLVAASSKLNPEELHRDFGTADKSVLGTLVHIFAADRVWLGRVLGNPPAKFIDPETDMNSEVLVKDWPPLIDRWKAVVSDIPDVTTPTAYKDLRGNPYSTPLWQIVLHMVNHATHHRGQVSGMLRSMGHAPPGIDLIHYYRQR